ncbi:MAG TPA: carbohydrate kinase family protein [Candidatus Krumholzibacteriaceae bacterium]|jgi:ribokinase|nr:carbohydrate kinase family protein [Candidatus Krumholzibacteriaceae bacterium]
MKLDVIGLGALNVDKLFLVEQIAKEDEESSIIDFEEACGGSAANTIVGLARLGLKTGYIGKIARDREGQLLLSDFKKEKVDIRGIVAAGNGRSGVVMGFVDKKGERAMYIDPGVNNSIKLEEINLQYANNTAFVHVSSFVGEKAFQVQKKLIASLSSDVKMSLDPGDLYADKGLTVLRPIIERCHVIFPNEHELKLLTNEDYEKGAETLLNEGVHIVAVKLGPKGCYVTNGREKHLMPRYPVKVVDTTGAGDAFCAGFLYGLIKNKSLERCGKLGNFVASKCIEKVGARTGLPYSAELPKNLQC